MHRLLLLDTPSFIAQGVSTLALPPPSWAPVPFEWNRSRVGAVPEIDVEIWADDTRALTAVVFGATPHTFTFADVTYVAEPAMKAALDLATKTTNCHTVIEAKVAGEGGDSITIAFVQSSGAPNAGALTHVGLAYTFTFKNGVTTNADFEAAITASADLAVRTPKPAHVLVTTNDEFAAANLTAGDDTSLVAAGHGLLDGDLVQVTTTGTQPTGLESLKNYWVIKDGTGELQLAASAEDAMSGIAVPITGVGTGTLKIVAVAASTRLRWTSHGLLGPAGDGAVALDATTASWVTRPHRPRVVAYALKATFGSGSGLVSAAIYPIVNAG